MDEAPDDATWDLKKKVFFALIIKVCACIALGFIAIKCGGYLKPIGTLQIVHRKWETNDEGDVEWRNSRLKKISIAP